MTRTHSPRIEGVTSPCRPTAQISGGGDRFIGRRDEIRQLLATLRSAQQAADARLVVITGAPGVGKTRLTQELAARARRSGCRVGTGRSWGVGGSPPLWPWHSVLCELGASSDLLARGAGRSVHERFGRFVAVLDQLQFTASSGSPLLVVLDDVHLADEASLLLARFIMREQRRLPLLFVMTRRQAGEELDRETAALLRDVERIASVIPLRGLPTSTIRSYLASCGLRSLDPALLDVIAKITDGNPLHLRQLAARSALDGDIVAGLSRRTEDTLCRLSPGALRIVTVAAVLGPETTVPEVAAVANVWQVEVEHALSCARALGIVDNTPTVAFVHDLVTQAVTAMLPRAERLDVHARAAAVLQGGRPSQVLRRTHHALEAAPRSSEDALAAVRIARETAAALRGDGGLEAAASLLHRACDLQAVLGLPIPAATLAIEHAEAVLACGRLGEARPLFERAAKVAESERDPLCLARAALGLAGMWLHEHRRSADSARVASLQRRAVAALPPDAEVLRARLMARLAAEAVYGGAPIALMQTALETALRTRDARARTEALSLYYQVLTGPEYAHERLVVAEKLIASAADAEDAPLTLMGLCARAAALFLLGDARADAALEELRLRAEALQCRSILFIVRAMEVMLTIRDGRLDEAETAAQACYALGLEVGDLDALAYYGAHLSAIRVFQGREAELANLVSSIAASPTLIAQRERSFALAAALFSLPAGGSGTARAELIRLRDDLIASTSRSSSWLPSMLALVELAAALRDRETARAAYDVLLPFADLPLMGSLVAVVCFGSTHRLLALAATTFGDHDRAVEHLSAAVTFSERIRHRPAAIRARAELGLACVERGRRDDGVRGYRLVQESIAAAEESGMGQLALSWRAALSGNHHRALTPPMATLAPAAQSGYWRVAYGDRVATLAERVGLRYLANLVAVPGQPVPALSLVADGVAVGARSTGQRVVDDRTLRALRTRVTELRGRSDLGEEEQEELERVTRELGRVLGLGGRSRAFSDVAERARTAVRKAIARAIEEITIADPAIGQHFAASVTTGASCCYRPAGSLIDPQR